MPPSLLNEPGEYLYDDRIRYWAALHGIPFALAKGLVAAESRFDAKAWRAEPHLGAEEGSRGLMQILLRTARGVGFTGAPTDLFEPDRNLSFGLKFFAGLLARPSYNVPDAVAAYNMGSPRKAADTTPFIIKIYGEPRPDWVYANEPYVRRVLMNAAFYQAVEDNNAAAIAAVQAIVKKKRLPLPVQSWSWTRGSSAGQPQAISGTFDWPLLLTVAQQLQAPPA